MQNFGGLTYNEVDLHSLSLFLQQFRPLDWRDLQFSAPPRSCAGETGFCSVSWEKVDVG